MTPSAQFADSVRSGAKRQTIRARGKRPPPKPGEIAHLYQGLRTKHVTCGGVDALQWARRPDKLIEGLKAWSARQLPAVLAQRVAALQAAGRLAPEVTPAAVIARAAPTLNPASFNALRGAFVFLDKLPC